MGEEEEGKARKKWEKEEEFHLMMKLGGKGHQLSIRMGEKEKG